MAWSLWQQTTHSMTSATEIARALQRCYGTEGAERMLQELYARGADAPGAALVDDVWRALRGGARARAERAAKSKARRQLAALFEK